MAKYSLIKTIEAQKLNKRTGVPTTDPPVTVPFGAIIEDVQPDRDMQRFLYHGEPYRCPADVMAAALDARALEQEAEAAAAPAVAAEAASVAGGHAAVHAAPAASSIATRELVWEEVASNRGTVLRAKVPGGWLVSSGGGLTFYPDPANAWVVS